MVSVAVVSSIYGGIDEPIAPEPQDIPCEFILVTDRPYPGSPWRQVVEPRPHMHPRMAAKVARARPDLYTDAEYLIWADGNLAIRSTFASWMIAGLSGAELGCMDSRAERPGGIAEEALVASSFDKYAGQDVLNQAASYLAEGFPPDFGQWWSGLMIRHRTCRNFGDAWLREMTRWSVECQVSLPYVLWKAGLKPVNVPFPGFDHFTIRGHVREP